MKISEKGKRIEMTLKDRESQEEMTFIIHPAKRRHVRFSRKERKN